MKMVESGRSPGTAHQAHRTVRTALNVAVRRGISRRTPPPSPSRHGWRNGRSTRSRSTRSGGSSPAAERHRNRARWAVALALGLRQSEALRLRWADIDLDAGRMVIRRSLQRPKWAHGCDGNCGRRAGSCLQRRNVHRGRRNQVPGGASCHRSSSSARRVASRSSLNTRRRTPDRRAALAGR